MNTAGSSNDAKAAGGYGNVEFNGLPATSNGYILDGYDSNDPWLGLNIGLSTNLVIGLDAVDQATVNTNSYSVDQGRYGASQVNYFTKSGTNQFHGDVYEIWNGSLLNAENYFLHANDTPGNITQKPRSNVNEFGVSVGGPIRKDKLFFFAHYEGIRIALPLVVAGGCAVAGLPAICAEPVAAGRHRPDHRHCAARRACARWRSTSRCSVFIATPRERRLPSARARWMRTARCFRARRAAATSLTAAAAPTSAGVAEQQRLRESDRGQDRPHHRRATTASGTAFSRTRACRPLTPIPSIRSSTPISPQPQRTLVAGYTHVFSSESGQPVQSRRELVLQHLRAEQLCPGASRHSPSCSPRAATTRRSPPSAATTTPIRRAAR